MKITPRKALTVFMIIAILLALIATIIEFLTYLKKDKIEPTIVETVEPTSDSTIAIEPTPTITIEVEETPTPTPTATTVTATPTPTATPTATAKSTVTANSSTTDQGTGTLLMLVNSTNKFPSSYEPDLTKSENGKYVDSRMADALDDMLAACRKAGYSPLLVSGYRSVDYQTGLFERQTQKYLDQGYNEADAKVEAAKWVAVPGTSEHHTGLAVDITDSSYTTLNSTQADTDTQKWLLANHQNYGFILRYPSDKEDITKIVYEPWHYRYVGIEIAKEITEKGITLEEYLS